MKTPNRDVVENSVEARGTSSIAYRDYRPSDLMGMIYTLLGLALLGLGIWLSTRSILYWLAGQLLLAVCAVQWFSLLHEAGHKTLFKSSIGNRIVGHFAGFITAIPYASWKIVHARHHFWAGWQDVDPTTQALAPRSRPSWIRWTVRFCWACWIPIFSIVYRLTNYWDLRRLWSIAERPAQRRRIMVNMILLLGVYACLIIFFGPWLFVTFGLAWLITLVMQDLLILSQHTHVPMRLAGENSPRAFPPHEQDQFTRTLAFPSWFSQWILVNLDAHSLHHRFPAVPGYFLQQVQNLAETHAPTHRTPWYRWIVDARRVRGDQLLFQNWDETGFHI